MEDASLDDFLDAGDDEAPDEESLDDEDNVAEDSEVSEAEDSEPGEPEAGEVDSVEDETDGEHADEGGVEAGTGEQTSVTATYRYEPSGASCEDCGETVTSRWHDGDALVCAACKPW